MKTQSVRERLLASTMIAGAALAAFSATPAAAQDGPTAVQEIVITGSRIPQANLETTSPVTQVTGEDIDIAGVTRVEDLVNQLPQAFAAQNSTVANGASGTATVSLRNLGADRTLVLMDGRRMPYGSPNDPAADLNQIPGQLVERVEVLTGGASAVYGSDALAGVVNFIMRRDFQGVQLDAQYGFFQHSNDYDGVGNVRQEIARRGTTNPSQFRLPDDNVIDGYGREATLIIGVGTDDGRGNITAYASYRSNDAILQSERDYSACAIGAPNKGSGPDTYSCGGSGTSYPGMFTADWTNLYTLDGAGGFRLYDDDVDAYNFGPLNYYQRPDERYAFGAFAEYEINDRVEIYADLMYSDYSSIAQIAPSGIFFNTDTINCDNPFLTASMASTIGCTPADIAAGNPTTLYIGRRNVEGGGRQDDLRYQSYRMVGGLRGELNDVWSYDANLTYSRVQMSRVYNNDFSVTRIGRALDVVTDPGSGDPVCRSVLDGTDPNCVPYNPFALDGVTQEALDYLQIPLMQSGSTTQQVAQLVFTGDLGAYGMMSPWASRGVGAAFGLEYRRDELESTTDNAFATGDGAGQGGPTIGLSGVNDVYDLFFEFDIPLIEGRPFFDELGLDLAYRYSDYELGGTANSWAVGLDWAPVPSIRFRGSVQKAIRAPNVIELFQAQGFNLFDMDADPCGDVSGTSVQQATLAQCEATGVPTAMYGSAGLNSPAGQYNFLQGGNTGLIPETADTYTVGVVFQPDFLPGFNLSIDYFNIEVENLIGTVGALNIIDACYQNNVANACALINRNAAGSLWVGEGHVSNLNTNIGGLRTSGVDIVANYSMDLGAIGASDMGSLSFNFVGTWLESLETDTGLGFANSVYDCAGFHSNQCGVPNPEWRHRARVSWQTPWNADISATWRYYGETELAVLGPDGSLNNGGTRLDRFFEAENYIDLAATWQVRDTTRLRFGVNNVFDNDPPLSYSVGTTGNGNTYPQLYDSMGRWVFFGITQDF